jgi:HEAT repeat protein
VTKGALHALAWMKAGSEVARIARLIGSGRQDVRRQALETLVALKNRECLPLLREALSKESDPEMKAEIEKAILRIERASNP